VTVIYLDDFIGAVQEELDTDNNSCDHHGSNDCACYADDHVFPGDTWLLAISRFLECHNQNGNIIDWIPKIRNFNERASSWRDYRRAELTMGHGSNGSTDLDGSHESWVSIRDPLTHEWICKMRTTVSKTWLFYLHYFGSIFLNKTITSYKLNLLLKGSA